jgi:cell division protein FtsB
MSIFWKTIIFVMIIILLGTGIYKLWLQNKELEDQVGEFDAILHEIQNENRQLEARISYFQNPENLLKEIKSQFNYREQGEEMIIIVPSKNGEE